MKIKNLKLGKKLGLSFSILLILTTIANIYALSNFKKTEKISHNLFNGPYVVTTESMGIRKDLVGISRRINGGFADKEHVETRKLVLEEFNSLNNRIDIIRKVNLNFLEDGIIDDNLDTLETNVAELRKEYEKIYNITQQEGFSGNMADIDISEYAKIFGIITESSTALYEEAQTVATEFDKDVSTTVKKSVIISIGLSAFSVVSGVVIAIYITKRLTHPIKEIEIAANKMSVGEFDISINYESKDELGSLSNGMREMSYNINEIINDTVRVLGEIALGNFDVSTEVEYIGIFKNIENSVIKITEDLSETMSEINVASEEVGSASDQVASGSQMLSQGATEQAGAIEELSATIMDISEKIKDTAENARKTNNLTMSAERQVKSGNEQMKEMIKAMEEISLTSNEIGRIIKTIDDIAFQTNILALNAAVEAARAGSAGKGFAVVADEVRNLAAKSAEAAKSTASLIENSIKAVENGTLIVDNTAQSLQRIINATNRTNLLVNEIAKACEEEASAINQVTIGVEQISEVVQTNSATAEESAAASEELSGQAQMLKSLIENFKLKEKNNFYNMKFNNDITDNFEINELESLV